MIAEQLEKVRKIAQNYGYEAQTRQLTEKIGKLFQAMNKYWRKDLQCGKHLCNPWDGYMPEDSEEYWNLVEKIADMEIMLEQMKFFLAVNDNGFDGIIQEKLDRQIKRMEEENAD
ncbi:hypothetical protein B5F53_11710 [Blautia sp. An249]|uniref:hypothetical protein n=1 Tax=Blautia sp. An249 TaxID=1965603 RepID=UPI000B377B31|nr:hypothetical protein [Blautia sp. An249]OUO78207.1 hypothetical protein B5F53_11710 [Blautia sp. An249]